MARLLEELVYIPFNWGEDFKLVPFCLLHLHIPYFPVASAEKSCHQLDIDGITRHKLHYTRSSQMNPDGAR